MTKCRDYILDVGKASSCLTMTMWISDNFIPDFYYSKKRVPICWEWGVELD
jgi:hypothetical protein